MKTSNLHDLWSSPDNTRLASKQFSFRLPTHIAAKIAALCEMYSNKNRTQVVADLLTSALDELEQNLPEGLGMPVDPSEQQELNQMADYSGDEAQKYYYLGGARGQFHDLSNKFFRDYEEELSNNAPASLYTQICVTKASLKKG